MTDLPDLARRFSRAAQEGRGIRLSSADVSIFRQVGVIDAVAAVSAPVTFPERGERAALARARGGPVASVYFVQRGDGPVKIGKANDPQSRFAGLQTACPEPLTLLATSQYHDEADLHRFYARERIRGEWFCPSPRLLAFVESLR